MTKRRPQSGHDVLLLWAACCFTMCLGSYVIFGRLESAIGQQTDRTGDLAMLARSRAAIHAGVPALNNNIATIEATLRGLQLDAPRPVAVASFIRCVTRIAAAQRVELLQIEEADGRADTAAGSVAGQALDLEAIPLNVTLSGSYRNLLAAICALASAPILVRIDIADVERTTVTAPGAASQPLTAHLHVELERLGNGRSIFTPAHAF